MSVRIVDSFFKLVLLSVMDLRLCWFIFFIFLLPKFILPQNLSKVELKFGQSNQNLAIPMGLQDRIAPKWPEAPLGKQGFVSLPSWLHRRITLHRKGDNTVTGRFWQSETQLVLRTSDINAPRF